MAKDYPEIGYSGHKHKWFRNPSMAPLCMAPGCENKATYRPTVETNWFRGDDVPCGPVCKAHSKDPHLLMEWTALRKAENKKRLAEIEAQIASRTYIK